jgi:anti-sigma regulatory factor (Ser/Thr protein kinase)
MVFESSEISKHSHVLKGSCNGVCLRHSVDALLKQYNYSERQRLEAGVVLVELCKNAHEHGNQYDLNEVHIMIRISNKSIWIHVQDSGHGFDVDSVLNFYSKNDELIIRVALNEQTTVRGVGLQLVRIYSDHILHNKKGNVICSIIYKDND